MKVGHPFGPRGIASLRKMTVAAGRRRYKKIGGPKAPSDWSSKCSLLEAELGYDLHRP